MSTSALRSVLLALLLYAVPAWTDAREEAARIESKLMAPCCWAETVAVHRSPTAEQIRTEIRALVGQGKSEREILDYYKDKYGARILIEPEGVLHIWENAVPFAIVAMGLVAVLLLIRHMAARNPEPAGVATAAEVDIPDEDL